MKKQMMSGRFFNMLTLVCVMTMLLVGLVPAERAAAYSVEVSYYVDGLDLDLGTVELDPTVVVILMGENIERILEPSIEKLNDFQPQVDIGMSFHPEDEEQLRLVLQNETQVALVEGGLDFDALNDDLLGGLEFKSGDVKLPVTLDTLLVLKTDEDEYYKLRFEDLANFAVTIDYAELGKGNGNPGAVPEPSTFLLLGLGLLGMIHMMKRKKGVKSLLLLLLAWLMLGSPLAFAQEDVITITKEGSSGDGTIVYGEYRCEPGCTEFTIPYSEGMGTVLKAIPDEDSRFILWRREDNTPLQGEFQVEPGETISVLFQNKRELFTEIPGAESPELTDSEYVRGRYVEIFPELLLMEEGPILFNLFDDITVPFTRDKLEDCNYNPSDGDLYHLYNWLGFTSKETDAWKTAFITFNKVGFVSGAITVDDKQYTVELTSNGVAVFEIDPSIFPEDEDIILDQSFQLEPSPSFRNQGIGTFIQRLVSWFTPSVAYAQSTRQPIDVMVLYTQEARLADEQEAKTEAERLLPGSVLTELKIIRAERFTNFILENSGVESQIRLVHVDETEFSSSGDLFLDLRQLTKAGANSRAVVKQIHELRDKVEADVVMLWVDKKEKILGGDQRCGAGYVMNDVGAEFADYAFAVVRADCAEPPRKFSMAHELGHLLAARHDRMHDTQPVASPFSYNYGYIVFVPRSDSGFRGSTVMAVDPLSHRGPFFSNPERFLDGVHLGVPEGEPDAADNRKTLNTTWPTVAAFRPKPTPTPTPTPDETLALDWSISSDLLTEGSFEWDETKKTWEVIVYSPSEGPNPLPFKFTISPQERGDASSWFANTVDSLASHHKPCVTEYANQQIQGTAYASPDYTNELALQSTFQLTSTDSIHIISYGNSWSNYDTFFIKPEDTDTYEIGINATPRYRPSDSIPPSDELLPDPVELVTGSLERYVSSDSITETINWSMRNGATHYIQTAIRRSSGQWNLSSEKESFSIVIPYRWTMTGQKIPETWYPEQYFAKSSWGGGHQLTQEEFEQEWSNYDSVERVYENEYGEFSDEYRGSDPPYSLGYVVQHGHHFATCKWEYHATPKGGATLENLPASLTAVTR